MLHDKIPKVKFTSLHCYSLYGVMDLLGFFHLVRDEAVRSGLNPPEVAETASAGTACLPSVNLLVMLLL